MSRGWIFDLQRYAVHDGPGIRTLVFLKGCPLRCAWCCNPESQQGGFDLLRRSARCAACGACAEACPSAPDKDRDRCRSCPESVCVSACPRDALARVGREVSAGEVLEHIELDRDFYRNSGGGATFSGGEPFFQPDFLGELLAGCRGRGIGTAVETCGFAPARVMAQLEPLAGLILFDLKVLDAREHLRLTGQDNGLILENFRRLAGACPEKLRPRLTLVPGVSDSPENLAAVAGLLRQAGLAGVDLLPYHPLGLGKWEGLGREAPCRPDPELAEPAVAEAQRRLGRLGIACSLP